MLRDKSKDDIRQFFGSISSEYGVPESEGLKLLLNFEMQQLLTKSLGETDPTASVLDVGCGWGRYLCPVSRHSSTAIGIDISIRMLQLGKKRCQNRNVEFVQADMEHLPFRDAAFNLVYSIRALNYSPNQMKTLKEICRVSKNDSHIMLYLINNILSFAYFAHLIKRFLRSILGLSNPAWLAGISTSNPYLMKKALGVSGCKNITYKGVLYVPQSLYGHLKLKRLFRTFIFLEGVVPSFLSRFAYGILYCSEPVAIEDKKKSD